MPMMNRNIIIIEPKLRRAATTAVVIFLDLFGSCTTALRAFESLYLLGHCRAMVI